MNPWLLFIGPFVAIIFPPAIPVLLIIAVWQLTDGGRTPADIFVGRLRMRHPERDIEASRAARGPLPTGMFPYDDERGTYDR